MGTNQYGQIGGVDSMVSSGRFLSWHGKDVQVAEKIRNAEEALVKAGMAWHVDESPSIYAIGVAADLLRDGDIAELAADMTHDELLNLVKSLRIAPEHKTLVRDDSEFPLSIMGNTYAVAQNDELAAFAQAILDVRSDAWITTALALDKGKQTIMTVQLDEFAKEYARGVAADRYIVLANSHDGSLAMQAFGSSIIVQCSNTLRAALAGKRRVVSLRHSTNMLSRLEDARLAIQSAVTEFEMLDSMIDELLGRKLGKTDARQLIEKITLKDNAKPTPAQVKAYQGVMDEYNAEHNANIVDTAWGVLMAANGYELWDKPTRGQARESMQAKRLVADNFPLTERTLSLLK